MKTKKNIFIMMTLGVLAISAIFSMASLKEFELLSKLSLSNIEALTQNESNYKDSSSVGTVSFVIKEGYYQIVGSSITGIVQYIWLSPVKEDINCCVESNQSSKCDQSQMDQRCS